MRYGTPRMLETSDCLEMLKQGFIRFIIVNDGCCIIHVIGKLERSRILWLWFLKLDIQGRRRSSRQRANATGKIILGNFS